MLILPKYLQIMIKEKDSNGESYGVGSSILNFK